MDSINKVEVPISELICDGCLDEMNHERNEQ
jgi:hypothetical protein